MGDTGPCGSVQISWAEHWQNRARRGGPRHTPARGGSGAPLRGPWLARRPPPAAPDKRAPPGRSPCLGGAPAGSGPGASPYVDGLSLVSGKVIPHRSSCSNHVQEGGCLDRAAPWGPIEVEQLTHPYQAHSPDGFKLVGREGPAHWRRGSDRGYPFDTVTCRSMWHAGGTTVRSGGPTKAPTSHGSQSV
jgi:hypothetical protein